MHSFGQAALRHKRPVYGQTRRRRVRPALDSESDNDIHHDENKAGMVCSGGRPEDASTSKCVAQHRVASGAVGEPKVDATGALRTAGSNPSDTPCEARVATRRRVLAAKGAQPSTIATGATDSDSDGAVKSPYRSRTREQVRQPVVLSSSSASESGSDVDVESEGDASDSDKNSQAVDDAAVEEIVGHLSTTTLGVPVPSQARYSAASSDASVASSGPSCLLQACGQTDSLPFSQLLDGLEALHKKKATWRKIGEASYSEVFGLDGAQRVVKVIPLHSAEEPDEDESSDSTTSLASTYFPERSYPRNVRREVAVTRALSGTSTTFVTLHAAYVAHGPYPQRLLRAWDAKHHLKSNQNVRPDVLPDDQLYSLLVLSDAGCDLENIHLSSYKQAAGIFCQVVKALSDAEQSCHFEHRDLHWGNVVVRPTLGSKTLVRMKSNRLPTTALFSPHWSGIQATIIDFTLARAEVEDAVTANPFDDEAFFTGKGDIQFDVYRQMRDVTRGKWKEHHPRTNVLWLRYLLTKLMQDKQLRPPCGAEDSNVEPFGESTKPAPSKTESNRHYDKQRAAPPANDGNTDEALFCYALLAKTFTALQQDADASETCARFASAGHVLRFLATATRSLS